MLENKRYIYAVYQDRSFSKAARRLHISQPWLSAVVKKEEQELKLTLFNRDTHPLSLTTAGAYYIEQIEKLIAIEDAMKEHLASFVRQGKLRIGSSMFFCMYVLPRLMDEFRENHPQLALSFTEGTTEDLTPRLLAHQLDILLEVEKPDDPLVRSVEWGKEELVLAVPAHNPLNEDLAAYCYTFDEYLKRDLPGCSKPRLNLSAVKNQAFLMLEPGNDSYDRIFRMCAHAGFTPKISMSLTQMMTAYYLVCEGKGITFLRSTIPEYVLPTDSLRLYELDDPEAVRPIWLSYGKNTYTPVQEQLIAFMKKKRN